MRIMLNEEIGEVNGAGGIDWINDAAQSIGGAVAGAVDSIQYSADTAVAKFKHYMITGQVL